MHTKKATCSVMQTSSNEVWSMSDSCMLGKRAKILGMNRTLQLVRNSLHGIKQHWDKPIWQFWLQHPNKFCSTWNNHKLFDVLLSLRNMLITGMHWSDRFPIRSTAWQQQRFMHQSDFDSQHMVRGCERTAMMARRAADEFCVTLVWTEATCNWMMPSAFCAGAIVTGGMVFHQVRKCFFVRSPNKPSLQMACRENDSKRAPLRRSKSAASLREPPPSCTLRPASSVSGWFFFFSSFGLICRSPPPASLHLVLPTVDLFCFVLICSVPWLCRIRIQTIPPKHNHGRYLREFGSFRSSSNPTMEKHKIQRSTFIMNRFFIRRKAYSTHEWHGSNSIVSFVAFPRLYSAKLRSQEYI